MIKLIVNRDPEFRFFGRYSSVVPYRDWLYSGYVINLYWFQIEIAKFWEPWS